MVLSDEGIEAGGIERRACPRDGIPSSVRGQRPRSVLLALNHRGMREAFRVNLRPFPRVLAWRGHGRCVISAADTAAS